MQKQGECEFCGNTYDKVRWFQRYCCKECKKKGWVIEKGKEYKKERGKINEI